MITGGGGKAGSASIVWDPDGAGDATTWAGVMALIGSRKGAQKIQIDGTHSNHGNYQITDVGEYDLKNSWFEAPRFSGPGVAIVDLADGVVLRNLARCRNGAGVRGNSTSGPCLVFDPTGDGQPEIFSLEANGALENKSPNNTPMWVPASHPGGVVVLVAELSSVISPSSTAPIIAVPDGMILICGVYGGGSFPDGFAVGAGASGILWNHDGSAPSPLPALPGLGGLVGQQLFNGTSCADAASLPASFFSPIQVGALCYQRDTGELKLWTGSVWVVVSGGGASGPPNAASYFGGGGALTGDSSYLAGALDAFQRPCVRDFRLGPTTRGAVYKLGAWGMDGDPQNVISEGFVTYGADAAGVGPSATNGGLGFYTPNSFGVLQATPAVNGGNPFYSCGFEDGGPMAPFGLDGFVVNDNTMVPIAQIRRSDNTARFRNLTANVSGDALGLAFYGDGADGAVVYGPGITTLTDDVYATTIEIQAGADVYTGGRSLMATMSIIQAAGSTIHIEGDDAAGAAHGAGGGGDFSGVTGGDGQTAAGLAAADEGYIGGAGGDGGAGSAGAGGAATPIYEHTRAPRDGVRGNSYTSARGLYGGAGGGGGGGDGINSGGGGGGGAGTLWLAAPSVTLAGAVNVSGGDGAAGVAGNAGGGGGGGGGILYLVGHAIDVSGAAIDVAGGAGGAGVGTGAAGVAGAAGEQITITL